MFPFHRALAVFALAVATTGRADDAKDLKLMPGWLVLGNQQVRDGAEKDLAVLLGDRPLVELRVCAIGNAVRLRNATAWLPGDQRQKLWLPLVIEAGRCSGSIKVRRAPRRVTHVAFDSDSALHFERLRQVFSRGSGRHT